MGRFFEDFSVGEKLLTPGRTVGEGDISAFAGLVGDFTPIHMDEHYARTTRFGTRIAHGTLVMSVAIGLLTQLNVLGEGVIGLLNLHWDFKATVKIGDTIHARVTVEEARRTSKAGAGIVRFRFEVLNQDEVLIQQGNMTVMLRTRDAAA